MRTGVNNFTAERISELRKNIDLSDIPEIKDFSTGHLRKPRIKKTEIHMRVDSDVLEWYKSQGKGYQTKMNEVLRAHAFG